MIYEIRVTIPSGANTRSDAIGMYQAIKESVQESTFAGTSFTFWESLPDKDLQATRIPTDEELYTTVEQLAARVLELERGEIPDPGA